MCSTALTTHSNITSTSNFVRSLSCRYAKRETHPLLVKCLTALDVRSPKQQLKMWMTQKLTHQRTTSLITSLGKPSVTAPQAKRLDSLGITHKVLVDLWAQSIDEEEFCHVLSSMKVNSKTAQTEAGQADE